MRIAWFSPRVPEHTEIANHTQRLEEELHAHFEACFLAEQPGGFYEPAAEKLYPAEVGQPPQELIPALNGVDIPIYNLGNNPAFFLKTWFLSQIKPGIVVLHDLKLHQFFEGIYRERLDDRKQYLALMDEYYGAAGVKAGNLYWDQALSIDHMVENFPMTAWGVRNALAVVVHTSETQAAIEQQTGLPVILNALPYQPRDLSPDTAKDTTKDATKGKTRPAFTPQRPARLVIFGYLNVNRRVVEFLQALSELPERASFEVHLYGALLQQYDTDVRAAVKSLGMRDRVKFHGYVPEAELDAGLANADLAINLRYPTMGEASASQLRIWDHSLPSLVTRVGAYASMPADTVSFVRPDHEKEDIQRHLRDFLVQPQHHRLQGVRGRQQLIDHHHPATYVKRLHELCEGVLELRSRHVCLAMATRIGQTIAPWSDAAGEVEGSYAARIAEAF